MFFMFVVVSGSDLGGYDSRSVYIVGSLSHGFFLDLAIAAYASPATIKECQ